MTKLSDNRIEKKAVAIIQQEMKAFASAKADLGQRALSTLRRLETIGYQLFPQPLDDKELEKEIVALAIKTIMVGNVGGEIILHNLPELATKVRALLQPKIEEAIRDANPRGWQALKGGE